MVLNNSRREFSPTDLPMGTTLGAMQVSRLRATLSRGL
jgi:hypothetical protein